MQSYFSGVQRVLKQHSENVFQSHIAIIGLGGIGSWVVEALARTGVKQITLMDMDDICVSNINRQVLATHQNIGQLKVDAMERRIKEINPLCEVKKVTDFFTPSSKENLFELQPDIIIDCIDSLDNKCLLIYECFQRNIRCVSCGGAAGKDDISQLRIKDIARTYDDPLLFRLRKKLRREYNIKKNNLGIACVFSTQKVEKIGEQRMNCNDGLGTVSHFCASMAMMQVQKAIELCQNK